MDHLMIVYFVNFFKTTNKNLTLLLWACNFFVYKYHLLVNSCIA